MFSFINRTVFDIPLTWDRTRFEGTRAKCRHARKLVKISVNVQFEKQLKYICLQNVNIEKTITEINENLLRHKQKVHIFDNLTEIALQSLPNHFNQRMENIRTIIEQHCHAIKKVLHEENDYWKEIHSAIDQKLITSNDLRTINKEQNTLELLNDNSPTLIEEHLSVVLPPRKSTRINTTHVVKLEETMNRSSSYIPPNEIEVSPMYSQPNPPARLYFSPTFLQDEESEPIRTVLSPLDQNQTNKHNEFLDLTEPKVIIHRISQRFLLKHLKMDRINNIHIQPKNESNNYHQNSFPIQESRTRSSIKNQVESIHITKTRKRKQSPSENNDRKPNTIALRKRKSVSIIEIEDNKPKKTVTKRRKTKKNQIPIRKPSPLPDIDRSKHYSTCFSTRSHRLNNFTLSITNTEIQKPSSPTAAKHYPSLLSKSTSPLFAAAANSFEKAPIIETNYIAKSPDKNSLHSNVSDIISIVHRSSPQVTASSNR